MESLHYPRRATFSCRVLIQLTRPHKTNRSSPAINLVIQLLLGHCSLLKSQPKQKADFGGNGIQTKALSRCLPALHENC